MVSDVSPMASRANDVLAAAGLSPADEEIMVFEMIYPILRSRADTIYQVPLGPDD